MSAYRSWNNKAEVRVHMRTDAGYCASVVVAATRGVVLQLTDNWDRVTCMTCLRRRPLDDNFQRDS